MDWGDTVCEGSLLFLWARLSVAQDVVCLPGSMIEIRVLDLAEHRCNDEREPELCLLRDHHRIDSIKLKGEIQCCSTWSSYPVQ